MRFHLHHALLATILLSTAHAQTNLAFDVATIRSSQPGIPNGSIHAFPGGNGYTAQNITVKLMISLMYKIPMRQIEGGPDWLNSEHFDVEAKTDHPYNIDDLQTMYQNLLAERFGLKFHKVIRQGPVYTLTIDPSGLKMKPNTTAQDFKIPMNGPPEHTVGIRVSMPYLCWALGQILQRDERPIVDNTGLTGTYGFTLSYTPSLSSSASDDQNLPSIFTAIREQLGLKLKPQEGPVEYYVIDDIHKPSSN